MAAVGRSPTAGRVEPALGAAGAGRRAVRAPPGRVRARPARPSTRRSTSAATSAPGDAFDGPAIVEERETTAVIRPGWNVEVAADGSLIATRAVSD